MAAVGVIVQDNTAARQTALMSGALDMPQPDLSPACAECCTKSGRFSQATAQLQAHHVGLAHVPAMVTDSPPLVMAKHLNSARTLVVPIG